MPFDWQPGHRITATRLKSGIQSGTVLIEFSTGSTNVAAASSGYDMDYNRKAAAVTFPAGFFSTTPFIMLSAESVVPGILLELTYSDVTTSGFNVQGARFTATDTNINWVAIEM